ncbi:hypothetical protein SCARD494_07823 [Seiridium cardinale]
MTGRYPGNSVSEREPHATFQYVFKWGFFGLNGLVYLAWALASELASHRERKLLTFMSDNFLLSFRNLRAGSWWTHLTSALSHRSFGHLFANMVAFNNYVPIALQLGLQPSELVFLTFGSALAGSAACVVDWKREGIYRASALGASGIVCGLGMMVTLLQPFMLVACPPLPRDIPLWVFTLGCFSCDIFGLGNERSRIGHAAHLGGMVYGAAWYLCTRQCDWSSLYTTYQGLEEGGRHDPRDGVIFQWEDII